MVAEAYKPYKIQISSSNYADAGKRNFNRNNKSENVKRKIDYGFDAHEENPLSVLTLEYRLWDEKPDAPTKLTYYKHTM